MVIQSKICNFRMEILRLTAFFVGQCSVKTGSLHKEPPPIKFVCFPVPGIVFDCRFMSTLGALDSATGIFFQVKRFGRRHFLQASWCWIRAGQRKDKRPRDHRTTKYTKKLSVLICGYLLRKDSRPTCPQENQVETIWNPGKRGHVRHSTFLGL